MNNWEVNLIYGNDPLMIYLSEVAKGKSSLDLQAVAKKLRECQINYRTVKGETALMLAVRSEKIGADVVKMLVEAGFDVNDVQDQEGINTIIMTALLCGASADKIQYLVDQGADLKFIVRGQNAFHFAIKGKNTEAIEILLKSGVDVNYGSNGMLPIVLAVQEYATDIVRAMLAQTMQPLVLNSTPEHKLAHPLHCLAIKQYINGQMDDERYIEMLDLLHLAGADINEREDNQYSALTYAIFARKEAIALHLLERGAQPNSCTDVFSACQGKIVDVLVKLIEHGASVRNLTKKGKTPVHGLFAKPNKSFVVPVNQPQVPEIHILRILEILAKNGADFNHLDDEGVVPLMMVESLKQFMLLENLGADLRIKIGGKTLLHCLFENPCLPIYNYAVEKLQDLVNEKDQDGRTPLQCCPGIAERNKSKIYLDPTDLVKVLLVNGGKIDQTDRDGRTELLLAVKGEEISLVKLLLDNGASIGVRDKKGNNIFHLLAKSLRADEMLPIIVKYSSREQVLSLLNGKNKKGDYPEDLARDPGIEYLFKERLSTASKHLIDVFLYENLFPTQLAKLRNGYQLQRAEISHEYCTDLPHVYSILHMPQEVILAIMKFAQIETVVALSMSCRQFKLWLDDNSLWRELLTREYKLGDRCQSVIECQDVKQELAKRWNAQVNMRHGGYFVYHVTGRQGENYEQSQFLDYDEDSRLAATISHQRMTVLDMRSLRVVHEVERVRDNIFTLDPHPRIFGKQKQIMYTFGNRCVHVMCLETGQNIAIPGLENALDFSDDGDFVAISKANGEIWVWNWATKEIIFKASDLILDQSCNFVFANGKLAHNTPHREDTNIWDIKSGALLKVEDATVSRKFGKYFVLETVTQSKRYYDTESGKFVMAQGKFIAFEVDPVNNVMAALDTQLSVTLMEYHGTSMHADPKVLKVHQLATWRNLLALHGHFLLLLGTIPGSELEVWDTRDMTQLYAHPSTEILSTTVRDRFICVETTTGFQFLIFDK